MTIEAVQWTGDNADEVSLFTGTDKISVTGTPPAIVPGTDGAPVVTTSETLIAIWSAAAHDWVPVPRGHYVIRGADGHVYALPPDVLAAITPR